MSDSDSVSGTTGSALRITAVNASQVGHYAVRGTDAALLLTLQPGAYTLVVSGATGDTGLALVEIYDVP